MEYIIADADRMCVGYLDEMSSIDVDIGETNDFELVLSRSYSEKLGVKKGFQFFIPDTEFGGIIEDVQSNTSYDDITYGGYTWRGYLRPARYTATCRQCILDSFRRRQQYTAEIAKHWHRITIYGTRRAVWNSD